MGHGGGSSSTSRVRRWSTRCCGSNPLIRQGRGLRALALLAYGACTSQSQWGYRATAPVRNRPWNCWVRPSGCGPAPRACSWAGLRAVPVRIWGTSAHVVEHRQPALSATTNWGGCPNGTQLFRSACGGGQRHHARAPDQGGQPEYRKSNGRKRGSKPVPVWRRWQQVWQGRLSAWTLGADRDRALKNSRVKTSRSGRCCLLTSVGRQRLPVPLSPGSAGSAAGHGPEGRVPNSAASVNQHKPQWQQQVQVRAAMVICLRQRHSVHSASGHVGRRQPDQQAEPGPASPASNSPAARPASSARRPATQVSAAAISAKRRARTCSIARHVFSPTARHGYRSGDQGGGARA